MNTTYIYIECIHACYISRFSSQKVFFKKMNIEIYYKFLEFLFDFP